MSPGLSTGYAGVVRVHAATSGCEFDVTGNMPARYDNTTGVLSFTSSVPLPRGMAPLAVENVKGCFGVIKTTDTITVEADYHLTGPAPLTITG
ncbi:hypothetical protein [Amycolatopsis pigmentata]|uniref:Uncharacterized protein n=1 Tax=Amycolatopsis pigmentata TaxID=450801 RepID=A0ABW5FZT2_9PSEU